MINTNLSLAGKLGHLIIGVYYLEIFWDLYLVSCCLPVNPVPRHQLRYYPAQPLFSSSFPRRRESTIGSKDS
jgi:hypothetical protein